jgi:carbon-monoxide dehydrogenase medium subunit
MKYFFPNSLEEVNQVVQQYQQPVVYLVGGTDLILKFKRELVNPAVLVNIKNIPNLREWEEINGQLQIGALTTSAEIMAKKIRLGPGLLALVEAAKLMASPQIRNRATVGGNIGNASPAGDLITALLALGGTVQYYLSGEHQTILLEDCFAGPSRTNLPENSLLTSIWVDKSKFNVSTFEKLGMRKTHEIAIVNAAAAAYIDQTNGNFTELRIAMGAVGPTPLLLTKASEFILALRKSLPDWSPNDWEELRGLLETEISPINDLRASKEYRLEMAFILL